MFCYYNKIGPLYIIQSKTKLVDKYQIQAESAQMMNSADEPVSIEFIIKNFNNDTELIKFLLSFDILEYTKEENKLYYESSFNINLDSLNNFISTISDTNDIQYLIFGEKFNQELKNSLDRLTNLKVLEFGKKFNQLLDHSLDNLANLTVLRFGKYFNQPLKKSLDKLTKLTDLKFGKKFNQPLDYSLDKLTNLKSLKFENEEYNYYHSINLDSLRNLDKNILKDLRSIQEEYYKEIEIEDFRREREEMKWEFQFQRSRSEEIDDY